MKKFFAMLLSLAMILSLSVPAFAAETETLYVDISNVADSSMTVSSVWLYAYGPNDSILVDNEQMLHVSGTTYSYPITNYESAVLVNISIFYEDDSYATYIIRDFGADGQNLYTITGYEHGIWSTYSVTSKDVTASYTPSGSEPDTSTLPDPIYFKNESGIEMEYVTLVFYDENDEAIGLDSDGYVWGTMTLVDGENDIYSYAGVPENAVKVLFGPWDGSATHGPDNLTIPTDGNNMFTMGSTTGDDGLYLGTWSVYTPSSSGGDEDDSTPATITGLKVIVDDVTYESGETVTLTSDSGDVIIIVTGTNFANLGDSNFLWYDAGSNTGVSTAYDWIIDTTANTATRTFKASDFENCTPVFEIKYSNDGDVDDNYVGTGIYVQYQSETEIVSVDITWSALSFTYDDTIAEGETEETGWTCEDGANKITVANNSTVAVNAAVAYAPAEGYSVITGKFQDVNEAEVTNANIDANGSYDFYMILSGKPEAAITAGTTIGSVTVTITEVSTSE